MRRAVLSAAVAACLLAAGWSNQVQAAPVPSECDAVAGNLVTNCGFEAGPTVTGWTRGGVNGVAFALTGYEHTGTRAVDLNFDAGGSSSISQTVGAAGSYNVSFWLYLYYPGVAAPADVSVSFAGQQLVHIVSENAPVLPYVQYQFVGLNANGPATLQFETDALRDVQHRDFFVDDVVVTANDANTVPEPPTVAIAAIALAALGVARRKSMR